MGNREPESRRRDADVRRLSRVTAVVGALSVTTTVGFGVLAATATGHVGHSGVTATTTSSSTSTADSSRSSDSSTQAVETDDTTTATATSPPVATSQAPVAVSGGS